jgi:hypothetical protein
MRIVRTRVFGFGGFSEISGADPVILEDDVFANDGSGELGLYSTGGVTATGITATGSTGGYEIFLSNAALTLDSSIVGDKGVSIGTGTCTSTFSRGPAVPGNCGFSSSADPLFADPSTTANDFHLLPLSTMIEAGNPAAPPAGELDFERDPRAVLATPGCIPRRDIGADEFKPAPALIPTGCPVVTPPPTTPPVQKKCKKHRKKHHRAHTAKKKCKKKKRKR